MKRLIAHPLLFVALLVLLFVVWQFFLFLRPRQRPYTEAEMRAVRRAAAAAATELAAQVGAPARFGVAHLRGDWKARCGDALRAAIAAKPGFTVEEGSPIRRFLDDIGDAMMEATSVEQILKAGQQVNMEVIVAGRVHSVSTAGRVSVARLEICAYDTRPGAWVVRRVFEGRWSPGPVARAAGAVGGLAAWKRFALWLLVVGALPWITAFFTRRALACKTNAASFALVGAYTLIGVFLALLLTGFQLSGTAASLRFLAAVAVAALYNYWACDRIAAREQ